MNWKNLLFSPLGRINRAKYWLAGLSVGAAFMVAYGVLMMLAVMTAHPDKSMSGIGILAVALMVALYCVVLYVSVILGIKRFHDRDRSGWFLLINLIPFGGIWVFIECGCLRGTVGRNRFGADPLAPTDDLVQVFGAPEPATIR